MKFIVKTEFRKLVLGVCVVLGFVCFIPNTSVADISSSPPSWDENSYTNWPGTDPEWTQLTNHIEWCWQALVEKGKVVGVDYSVSGYYAPTYIAPYRDYVRLSMAIDNLAPSYVCQTNSGTGNFQHYLTTTNNVGEYPGSFPLWTPESLHSYTFGKNNWTTNFALSSWMSITNRAIQREVEGALTNLIWTTRTSTSTTNEATRNASGWRWWCYENWSYKDEPSIYEKWNRSHYTTNSAGGLLYYVSASAGLYSSSDAWSVIDLFCSRKYAHPVLNIGSVNGLACRASWYLRGNFYPFNDSAIGSGWGSNIDADHTVHVEDLDIGNQTRRVGSPPFENTRNLNPFNDGVSFDISDTYDCGYHSASIDCRSSSYWLLKWDVEGGFNLSPPQLKDYLLVETPDTDLDDLVEVPFDIDSRGNDTGFIGFSVSDDRPCVYLPISSTSDFGPRVHAYFSQGAFTNLPYHYISHSPYTPWSSDGFSRSNLDYDGSRMAFSTATRILEAGVSVDENVHKKLVSVIRPRGNVVVFSFEWNGTNFCKVGYPTGINSKRSYVLVDMCPDNGANYNYPPSVNYNYELHFASGVIHGFDKSYSSTIGLLAYVNLPGGYSISPNNYYGLFWSPYWNPTMSAPTNFVSSRYSASIFWTNDAISSLTYTTRSVPPKVIQVDLTTTPDGFITQIEKSEFEETSAALSGGTANTPHNTVTYGSGVSVKRTTTGKPGEARDVSIVTIAPELGVSTTAVHLNDADRPEQITQSSDNGTAITTRAYQQSDMERYENNGFLKSARIQQISYQDGSSESFEYTAGEGWLTKATMNLGYGQERTFDYNYLTNGMGIEADFSSLVERPRRTEHRFGQENTLIGCEIQAYSRFWFWFNTSSEVCSATNSSWGTSENLLFSSIQGGLSRTSSLVGFPLESVSPAGTNTFSYTYAPDGSLSISGTDYTSGQTFNRVVTPFGVMTNQVVKENNIVIDKFSSQTDSFGRIIQTDYLNGTHVKYDDYCLYGPQSVTDIDGSIRTIAYYANGLVHSVVDGATGITTSYEYDPLEYLKTITRSAGNESEIENFRYDVLGRLRYYKDVCGAETTIEYTNDANGIYKVTTLPTGGILEEDFYYDGERRSIGGTAAAQKLIFERGVDDEGYYVKTINADNPLEFTIVHDSFLGVSSKIKQSGTQNAISLHYDDKARFTGATDECDISSLLSYNAKNQLEFFGDDSAGDRVPNTKGVGKLFRSTRDVGVKGITGEMLTYPTFGSSNVESVARCTLAQDGLSVSYSQFGRSGTFNQSLPSDNGTYTNTDIRPDGRTETLMYERWRLKARVIKDDNNSTLESISYEYTPLGYLDEVKSSRNGEAVTTKYGRDTKKRVNAITVGGKTTDINYVGSTRQVHQVIRPNKKKISYEYYANGLVESENDEEGYDSTYVYDSLGRCTKQVVRGDDDVTLRFEWEYDQHTGQLAHKKINDIIIESYGYRDNGQAQSCTDALANVFTPTYNVLGDQIGLTCASTDNLVINYSLGRLGQCTNVTSTSLVGHTYERTLDDLLLSDKVLGGGIVQNAAFAFGNNQQGQRNLMQFRLAGGPIFGAGIQHDGAARVKNINAIGGPSASYRYSSGVSFTTNLVLSATGGVELVRSVVWDYAHLRPLDIAYSIDGSNIASYAYAYVTNDTRIARMTSEDGSSWSYGYDSRGRLNAASRRFSDGTNYPGRLFAYAYDRFRNTTQAGPAPDGVTPRYTFNAGGIYNVHATRQWGSELDVSGTVVTNAKVVVNNVLASQQRNWFNATVTVSNQASAIEQTLRVYAAIPNYNAGLDLVTAKTGTVTVAKAQEIPAYNAKGEPISDSRFRYVFNSFGWLTSVTDLVSSPATSLAFAYDTGGRRVKKTVRKLSGATWLDKTEHQFYYDDWNLVAETITDKTVSPEATMLRIYTWGLDLAGQRGGQLGQSAGGISGLLAITEIAGSVTNLYYPISDHIGTIRALVDATSGKIVAEYEYDPYGVLLGEIGPKKESCPFRFSNKYYDSETQLLYFGYRYYNPASTKWLTVDPLQERGGLNFTAYCGGDPVNQVDPLGLLDAAVGVKLCMNWDEHGIDWEGWSIYGGFKQKVGDFVDLRADLECRLYSKGLGQIRGNEVKDQYDVALSVSATLGYEHGSAPVPLYYNSMLNASAFDSTFKDSLALGATWYYNSDIDDLIRTGSMNVRVENLYFQYMNDVNKFPKIPGTKRATDQGWTGGGVLGVVLLQNSSSPEFLEIGFQDFTGAPRDDLPKLILDGGGNDGYYDQDASSLLLNRAEWVFRYRRNKLALRLNASSSPSWNVQNWIHDGAWLLRVLGLASPGTPRFQYPEQDRRAFSIEYMPFAK